MNILLINHYAGTPAYGMEYRPYYLAREWVRSGHRVHIVASAFSHVRAHQPVLRGTRRDETVEGIRYTWLAAPPYVGNGVRRAFNMAHFVWRLFREARSLVTAIKPDVVIASSTYPLDIWPAAHMARMAGAQLIFEVHDLWPLTPIELGGMSRWHPFILLLQKAEDAACRNADWVVSLLPKAKAHLVSRGMHPDKFYHVPNGIDPAEWSHDVALPEEVAQRLAGLRQAGVPLVGYAGAHGLANALDVLLDAAALLRGKAAVVLVGSGPERARLLQRVHKEGLDHVVMLPALPKKAMPAFLGAIDMAYIGLSNNPLFRFGVSPNKLMDYMMAGKPVIHAIDAGNDLVSEAHCGITVAPHDASAVRDAVLQVASLSPTERARLGGNGRAFILKEQTYGVLAARFAHIMKLSR